MLTKAPDRPQRQLQFTFENGRPTEAGFQVLEQIWTQVAAGYVIVPCVATGQNDIVLTPRMHKEGGAALADFTPFAFMAVATSNGNVTIQVGAQTARQAYKSRGTATAGNGDVVNASLYIAFFVQALNAGAGGFVLT